jgi:hypothetical protein
VKQKADQYNDISCMTGKMLYGCVRAIDGGLTQINKPSNTADVDYFSSHLALYDCNLALCDCKELKNPRSLTFTSGD